MIYIDSKSIRHYQQYIFYNVYDKLIAKQYLNIIIILYILDLYIYKS